MVLSLVPKTKLLTMATKMKRLGRCCSTDAQLTLAKLHANHTRVFVRAAQVA